MHSLRCIILILALVSLCPAGIITCTVTDQSGAVVSNSCDGRQGTYGYHDEVHAYGSFQFWSVYVDAGFHVSNDYYSPLKTSISLYDYASFTVPMVVTGGSGSAYLWYSGSSYYGYHDASFGVTWGNAGGLGGTVSAPCYLDWPKDWDNQINCYIPFTYGVPLTLSGSARVNGHLSGNLEWDNWFFSTRANLMGIVSEPGRLQVAAEDVQIQVLPEPATLPVVSVVAAVIILLRRRRNA